MEAEAMMSQLKGVVPHHEREVPELSYDRELAVAYLKAAMESLDNPEDRVGGLLAEDGRVPGCLKLGHLVGEVLGVSRDAGIAVNRAFIV
jgi:hypothetical protein